MTILYKLFFLIALTIGISNTSVAEEKTTNSTYCADWIQQFSEIKNGSRSFVEHSAAKSCRAEIFSDSLDAKILSIFAQTKFIYLVYDLYYLNEKQFQIKPDDNIESISNGPIKTLSTIWTSVDIFVFFFAAIMFIINFYAEYNKKVNDKSGRDFQWITMPKTAVSFVVLLLCLPIPGLDISLYRGLLVTLSMFAMLHEQAITLMLLPNLFATFTSDNIDKVNPVVRNNALTVIEQGIVNPYLLGKKCELTNRNNLIFTLSENERQRLIASSSQAVLDYFNVASQTNLAGRGGRAYDGISETFNRAYSNLTDGTFSLDCGHIPNISEKATIAIASHAKEANEIMSDMIAYHCVHNKEVNVNTVDNLKSCLEIKNGIVSSDGRYSKLVTEALDFNSIREKKDKLIIAVFNDLYSLRKIETAKSDTQTAKEMINVVKTLSGAALPFSITVATLKSPSYMDLLAYFEQYKVVYNQQERDDSNKELFEQGQLNNESFYIAKDDVALNQLINTPIYTKNNSLAVFINPKNGECFKSVLNCRNTNMADLGNMQNVAFSHLNVANNIKWGMMAATLVSPHVKAIWLNVSPFWNFVIFAIVLIVFITIFLHNLIFFGKKLAHMLKLFKTFLIGDAHLCNILVTSRFDDDALSQTRNTADGIKHDLTTLALERAIYTVAWCIALLCSWLFAHTMYETISFTVEQNIEGTLLLNVDDLLKIGAIAVSWTLSSFILVVAPEFFTNIFFLKIMRTNRDETEDRAVQQDTMGWYGKFKYWTKPYF